MQQMRRCHTQLQLLSVEHSTCPDSERYPFLKELIELDKQYHANWEQYDHFKVGQIAPKEQPKKEPAAEPVEEAPADNTPEEPTPAQPADATPVKEAKPKKATAKKSTTKKAKA
jgi:hypothetical protein